MPMCLIECQKLRAGELYRGLHLPLWELVRNAESQAPDLLGQNLLSNKTLVTHRHMKM